MGKKYIFRKKAVYIGAGTDIEPLFEHPDILNWTFLDSQPASEFGLDRYEGFRRPYFLNILKKKFNLLNFNVINESENLITFKNIERSQIINYIINTSFPEEANNFTEYLKDWNVLIDKGYHPTKEIMDYCKKNTDLEFYGSTDTVYDNDVHEISLINSLYDEETISKKFKNFSFFHASKRFDFKSIKELEDTRIYF